mmetsp:Transcript_15237/g.36561  ORF Transcript_15237/g.36561 Transcript_15237/m.36561 type:complete len:1010 (-) Transcript_15237:95-3124(-)
MGGVKNRIDINDLRADKGGDPEIYRRALSMHQNGDGGDCSTSSVSVSCINEALSLDTHRRSALTNLESLRSKLSTLQKTVIAPKKKANEDVTQEVAQLKEWKIEIAKLSKEVKDTEQRRDKLLGEINDKLANIKLENIDLNDDKKVGAVDSKPKDCGDSDGGGYNREQNQNKMQQTLSASAAAYTCPSPATPTKEKVKTNTSSSTSLPILSPEKIKSIPPERILNLNVGVLGHVDTGKTSLVKTLSSVLSTASLDKSKQSRARGITLDLGFSAFLLPLPEHLTLVDTSSGSDGNSCEGRSSNNERCNSPKPIVNGSKCTDTDEQKMQLQQKYDLLQVTLVDCPGHASLIRTIIGGAQIIDMVLLVVDATKGIQTQTAECLVIAEMTTRNLIVVLNKVDLFPENEREERLRIAENKMRAALRGTKFEDAQMVGISACVGGEKVAAVGGASGEGESGGTPGLIAGTNNIHGLLNILQSQIRAPNRDTRPSPDRFHFAVDHCFPIKGQGTVLTGTCLSGSVRPNDMVEFPTLATQKKIKGLQMFRRKANVIQQGDRAGICVSNFDAKLMERGIIASPGTVKLIRGAIAVVRKVRFFKGGLNSGAKFHVSVGHTTVMATVTFWGAREIAKQVKGEAEKEMEKNADSRHLGKSSLGGSADLAGLPRLQFDWNQDFLHQDNYLDVLPSTDSNSEWNESTPEPGKRKENCLPPLHWARLEFLTPVYCPMDSLVIGSRLDSEVNANACRLAFSGRLVERYDAKSDHGRLKSYTKKEKVGTVCRLGDPYRRADDNKLVRYEVFGTDLFKKETNMTQFVGLLVETDSGDVGNIQSSFGTSGKFRVSFPAGTDIREGDPLYLRFKRYANDPKKAIHQDGKLPPARTGSRVDPPVKKKKNRGKNANQNANQNAPQSNTANKTQQNNSTPKRDRNSAVSGEVVKLKGDILDNGKKNMAIVSGFFSMEDDISEYKGRKVISASTEEEGVIDGSFGKMGKCKVLFKNGISAEIGSQVTMIGNDA